MLPRPCLLRGSIAAFLPSLSRRACRASRALIAHFARQMRTFLIIKVSGVVLDQSVVFSTFSCFFACLFVWFFVQYSCGGCCSSVPFACGCLPCVLFLPFFQFRPRRVVSVRLVSVCGLPLARLAVLLLPLGFGVSLSPLRLPLCGRCACRWRVRVCGCAVLGVSGGCLCRFRRFPCLLLCRFLPLALRPLCALSLCRCRWFLPRRCPRRLGVLRLPLRWLVCCRASRSGLWLARFGSRVGRGLWGSACAGWCVGCWCARRVVFGCWPRAWAVLPVLRAFGCLPWFGCAVSLVRFFAPSCVASSPARPAFSFFSLFLAFFFSPCRGGDH